MRIFWNRLQAWQGYRFFFRHYNYPQNWETVIYAIPSAENEKKVYALRTHKRILSPAASQGWDNVGLVKEGCTVPYLFYKNHNCESTLLGAKIENQYSNESYVKGLKMEFLPDGNVQTKLDYIVRTVEDIDCLTLRGAYPTYFPLVAAYKIKNPNGKVYLALDANPAWMDRIQWRDPDFTAFMNQCDVIGVSDHVMLRHLSEKWPWHMEYIPNGFYNFTGKELTPSVSKKKNIILTAGRLGTYQKATQVLLEAFALAAHDLPDWELRLAGSIAPEFESYISDFKQKHPDLMERVHFLGRVSDRALLYQEYLQAKVFALPSVWEGGAPNVIPEALTMGCAIAITKMYMFEDCIDGGRCGMASEINDIPGFADILLRLCKNEHLEDFCARAHAYALENYDMEKIVARLYKLLFGEEGRL